MPSWLPIVASLIGGGACGAVLKLLYDSWRDRKQPVEYKITTDSIFSSAPHAGALQAQAQVSHDGQTYPFDALSLVRIDIKNKGNRDLNQFVFGITIEEEHAIVKCAVDGEDRHHQIIEIEPTASPAFPSKALDFSCAPFNRRDKYTLRLYVRNCGAIKIEQVKLSSAAPIRFVRASLDDVITPTSLLKPLATMLVAVAILVPQALTLWSLRVIKEPPAEVRVVMSKFEYEGTTADGAYRVYGQLGDEGAWIKKFVPTHDSSAPTTAPQIPLKDDELKSVNPK